MNWDFFEEWADVPQEDREAILRETYARSGPFRDLVMAAPNRIDLEALKAGLAKHKQRNDR
jgi:hypothetical protein